MIGDSKSLLKEHSIKIELLAEQEKDKKTNGMITRQKKAIL